MGCTHVRAGDPLVREFGIAYTITATAGSVTVKAPTSQQGAGYYTRGMNVQGGLRTAMTDRPQQDGSYNEVAYESGLMVEMQAYLFGSDASSRQTLTDALVTVVNSLKLGGGTLGWTPQDASAARQLSAVSLAAPLAFEHLGGTVRGFQLLLKSEKPYSESATATEVDSIALTASGGGFVVPLTIPITFTSSGGGTLTYTNSGSVTVRPVLRVYGPITNPVVTNTTLGYGLSFSGSIAAGDFWEIDLFERTVTLNGVATATAPLRALVPASSTWFGCGVGASTLQLTGSSFDSNTKLRAYVRSAWS